MAEDETDRALSPLTHPMEEFARDLMPFLMRQDELEAQLRETKQAIADRIRVAAETSGAKGLPAPAEGKQLPAHRSVDDQIVAKLLTDGPLHVDALAMAMYGAKDRAAKTKLHPRLYTLKNKQRIRLVRGQRATYEAVRGPGDASP